MVSGFASLAGHCQELYSLQKGGGKGVGCGSLSFFLPKRNLFSRSFGSRSQIRMPAHLGSMKTSRFAEKVLCAQMTSWCVHVVRREKAL